ncbi:hypothetical protein PGTUg99_016500 [Puccinia graminis f. sp. tritici]|uniref:Uncharacterized protein n=1 Tax=Puccinia graminis f. sp. tritici TaxID=56615 RepID=A0A5B0RI75_PUCGR|nr:hypothetical protein PGTUg99_016500 [Puccinia graminis f. sp. tritici]
MSYDQPNQTSNHYLSSYLKPFWISSSDESNTIGILMRSSPQRPSLTREQLLLSFPHGGRSGPTGAAGRYMATCIPL